MDLSSTLAKEMRRWVDAEKTDKLDTPMNWPEIHSRLAGDMNDAPAWMALQARIRVTARRELGVHGRDVVEDAVAEVTSMVWRGFAGARKADTFGGFVYGHYLNARARAQRAAKRRQERLVRLTDGVDLPARACAAPAGRDELQIAAYRRALAALPTRERLAVTWKYPPDESRGLSAAQIGARLGVSEGNARQILFVGRSHLVRTLAAAGHGPRARQTRLRVPLVGSRMCPK